MKVSFYIFDAIIKGCKSYTFQGSNRHEVTDILLTDCQHLIDRSPTVNWQSVDCWPTDVLQEVIFSENLNKFVGQLSVRCWSTVGQLSANSRPTVGREIADSRPTDNQQSADR